MGLKVNGNLDFLSGGGEMGERIRSFDWAQTALGEPTQWDQSLKACVNILLHSTQPMFVWWGRDALVHIFNDEFASLFGNTYDLALGKSGYDTWNGIWPTLNSRIETVFGNEGTSDDDIPLLIRRSGLEEEAYFKVSYNPVSSFKKGVGGLFGIVTEKTQSILHERPLQTLKGLGAGNLENKQLFIDIFEFAPFGVAAVEGKEFLVTSANKTFFELMQSTYEQVIGKSILEVLPGLQNQGLHEISHKILEKGETYRISEVPSTFNTEGKPESRYFDVIYQPFRKVSGGSHAIISFIVDVTEKVLARKKMVASTQHMSNLVSQVNAGIASVDLEGNFIDMNDRYCAITGYSRQELLQKSMLEITHPEDVKINLPLFKKCVLENENFFIEKRYLKKDGSIVWVNNSVSIIINKGGERFITAVCIDITEQKNAQEALRQSERQLALELEDARLLQQLSNKIITKDNIQELFEEMVESAMKIMHADMGSLQILDKESKHLHLRAQKNFHPQSAKIWQKVSATSTTACGRSLDIGKRVVIADIEKEVSTLDDDQYLAFQLSEILSVQSTLLVSRGGEPLGVISTHWKHPYHPSERELNLLDVLARQASDLIEKKRSDAELRQFNLRLEQQVEERTMDLVRANKELESFNYIASHDMQEPLRKILTFINLIKKNEYEQKSTEQYFHKISESANRMSKLIKSVLNYSVISKSNKEFTEVDLNEVLMEVTSDFEILIEEKKAVITSSELPVIIANYLQMQQVFANLISNSIKFAKGDPEITITSKEINGIEIDGEPIQSKSNASKKFIQLIFTDNGIGFMPEHKSKIFEVFQRLHGKSEYSGTGIGLSIVKKIVEAHGGYISAESKSGEGAVFTIALPKS